MLSEKLKEEKEKLKKLNTKQKLDYIWGYYKIPIIAVIVGIIFVCSMVSAITSANRRAITLIIDLYSEDTEQAALVMENAFREYLGDEADNKEMISLDTSLSLDTADDYTKMLMAQKLMAMVTAHSANIMIASRDNILNYGAQGMFADLETLLDADTFKTLNDRGLLYTATIPEDTTLDEPTPAYTYYCGIDISSLDNALLEEAGFMVREDTMLAIPINADNEDRALQFLDLLLDLK